MPADGPGGQAGDPDSAASAGSLIDHRRRVVLWRARIVAATASVGWFLMGDIPAFFIALLGAAALALALLVASAMADVETRVIRLRRIAERRK